MESKNRVVPAIRLAFEDVPFPIHCGWNAALAKDTSVLTAKELIQITNMADIKGKWWEIPFSELKNCSLAQCYLDAKSVEFYLPAFMTGIVKNMVRPDYGHLISWLKPPPMSENLEQYNYFCDNFSLIKSKKKIVCVEVLNYIDNNLDSKDPYSKDEIQKILEHEFWSIM